MQFSAELMRDELAEDARLTQALQRFNPYCGNMMAAFSSLDKKDNESAFVAFPMGETYSDLSQSIHCSLLFAPVDGSYRHITVDILEDGIGFVERFRPAGVVLSDAYIASFCV